MGYRSHFALRRAGQTQLFASHWGGYRLLRDLLHGPAPVQAYVETRKPCDDLYYGDSVDGVALLDLDTRTLCFWGGDNLEIESVPALRRPYLRLLEQRWPGWSVRWMPLGSSAFAAALGVPAGEVTGLDDPLGVEVLLDPPARLELAPDHEGPAMSILSILDPTGADTTRDLAAHESVEALLSLGPALLELAARSPTCALPRETLPAADDELWRLRGGLVFEPEAQRITCWWNYVGSLLAAQLELLARFWPGWTLTLEARGLVLHTERSGRASDLVELPLARVAEELEARLFGEDGLDMPRLGSDRLAGYVETFGAEAATELAKSGVLSHDTGLDYPWALRGRIHELLQRSSLRAPNSR